MLCYSMLPFFILCCFIAHAHEEASTSNWFVIYLFEFTECWICIIICCMKILMSQVYAISTHSCLYLKCCIFSIKHSKLFHAHTHTLYKLTSSFSHIINYLHFINVKHTSGIFLDPFQTNTNKFWISMTCYGMLQKKLSPAIYTAIPCCNIICSS